MFSWIHYTLVRIFVRQPDYPWTWWQAFYRPAFWWNWDAGRKQDADWMETPWPPRWLYRRSFKEPDRGSAVYAWPGLHLILRLTAWLALQRWILEELAILRGWYIMREEGGYYSEGRWRWPWVRVCANGYLIQSDGKCRCRIGGPGHAVYL